MVAIKIQEVADTMHLLDEWESMLNAIEARSYRRLEATAGFDAGEHWPGEDALVLGAPAARVTHYPGRVEVQVALAGFCQEEIALMTAPGDLILRAETTQCIERRGAIRLKAMRRFALDRFIDFRAATARLDSGVLTIHAPTTAA